MPTLKPQYESFCRYYVGHGNATEAARAVGYGVQHASQQGYRLLRRSTILARIKELRDEIAERECLSLNAQLSKLEIAIGKALDKGQPAAVAKIVETQAKLARLFETGGARDATAALADEVRAALAGMAKTLGVAVPQIGGAGKKGA